MLVHTQILFQSHEADLLTFQVEVLRPKGRIFDKKLHVGLHRQFSLWAYFAYLLN